jgi:hypothetical protein
MHIQLLQGQFSANEALSLLTQLIHVKIKFHENKIDGDSNEEEIKMRETRIKQLQKDLYEARQYIDKKGGSIDLQAAIHCE